jgi:acyl-CoA synthetase (AMP-forming)/AMP-acid ligase II
MTFVEWAAANAGLEARDRLSSHAPLHFDLSVFDLYAAFRVGARVSLVPDQVGLFPVELTRWIRDERISVWYSVPSALIRLLLRGKLSETELPDLRTVIFAGEVFPVKYLRRTMESLPLAEFLNWYGPTETNVCTYYRVPRPLDPSRTNLPIGRACENTEVIAFNAHGRPIAPGEEGELYVRGPTVMLGYWGLPERTGEQLVDNPLQPAYRDVMYRTGDIVRLEESGDYTFVGRRDHMVKSRGYRIELGEIEAALYQHESVLEAAVLALPDDEIGARLVAIVVAGENRTVEPSDLRGFCAARLPRYMVPEQYVTRTTLPRTSTGKTDRAALMSEFTSQPTKADKRSTKHEPAS